MSPYQELSTRYNELWLTIDFDSRVRCDELEAELKAREAHFNGYIEWMASYSGKRYEELQTKYEALRTWCLETYGEVLSTED